MQLALGVKQRHAFFTARQQQGLQLELLAQVLRLALQVGFIVPGTDDLLEFGAVRGDGRGVLVA